MLPYFTCQFFLEFCSIQFLNIEWFRMYVSSIQNVCIFWTGILDIYLYIGEKEGTMSHRKFEHPRHGSLGFLPRKRASRHRGKGYFTSTKQFIHVTILRIEFWMVDSQIIFLFIGTCCVYIWFIYFYCSQFHKKWGSLFKVLSLLGL